MMQLNGEIICYEDIKHYVEKTNRTYINIAVHVTTTLCIRNRLVNNIDQ